MGTDTSGNSLQVFNASWFRTMLKQKRLSQRQLAKQIGLDPSALTLILQGKRRLQIPEVKSIADVLGRPLDDVLRAAGIKSLDAREPVIDEPIRRLITYALAHAAECTGRRDIQATQAITQDVSTVLAWLQTMRSVNDTPR